MLQRAGEKIDSKEAVLKIKDASYPAPFASELEYNSPVHGNWNIVHTGMQVPESIQIYVCADNCMRGVVLTAAEMNAADRFSFVILEEQHRFWMISTFVQHIRHKIGRASCRERVSVRV